MPRKKLSGNGSFFQVSWQPQDPYSMYGFHSQSVKQFQVATDKTAVPCYNERKRGMLFMANITSTVQELNLADNFLFGKVMGDTEICRRVLEKILNVPIKTVNFPVTRETADIAPDSGTIRLDVCHGAGASFFKSYRFQIQFIHGEASCVLLYSVKQLVNFTFFPVFPSIIFKAGEAVFRTFLE